MSKLIKTLATLCLLLPASHGAHAQSILGLAESRQFAADIAQRHRLDEQQILEQFSKLQINPRVLQLIAPPSSPTQRSWARYRPRFINEQRINQGVSFWREHAEVLREASRRYGVPEEIIVAIIGIETVYGRNTGNFGVMEALATLAFQYPRRAEFFRSELEQFLLLAHENRLDPLSIKGSFAGALGIPQFMPGSQRRFAVDFDNDGRIDLAGSTADAIGSVARFLEQHGWQPGQPIATPATAPETFSPALLDAGIRPALDVASLHAAGFSSEASADKTVTLVDLVSPGEATEFWFGFDNFYVITRYNRSSFYAMSVFQLSEAIKSRISRSTVKTAAF